MKHTREQVIQWCLDNGHAIETDLNKGETSKAEAEKGDCSRYIMSERVDELMEQEADGDIAVYECIEHKMSLLDLDEWQALNGALNVSLSREDFHSINTMLWENYEYESCEALPFTNAKTIAEALEMDDLKSEDARFIESILKEYGSPLTADTPDKEIE